MLLVTIANTPTVLPGVVELGFTLILIPRSGPCAVTGSGIETSVRHASAKTPLSKCFLINLPLIVSSQLLVESDHNGLGSTLQ